MLISIVMPSFNSGDTIKDSIESVLLQKYKLWELIICDDGSSDNTIDIINNFSDSRITIIKNKNLKGAAGARNSGIERISGEFLCFLDSDDIWAEDKLDVQLNFMISKKADFSYGSYYTFDHSITEPKGIFVPPETISFKRLLKSCDIGCLTVMLRVDSFKEFSFPYISKEDYAAWICCLKSGITAHKYPGSYAYYRLSKNSLSSNKLKEIERQFCVVRKFGNVGFLKAVAYLCDYIIKGIVKHYYSYKNN